MHTQLAYYRPHELVDEPPVLCHKEDATMTAVIFTDALPDGQEYGIMLTVTRVVDSIGDLEEAFYRQGERAMDEYRREHT